MARTLGDLYDIMEGLAELLGKVDIPKGKLRAVLPGEGINAPCVLIGLPKPIKYDQAMGRGTDELTFPARVYVSRGSDRAAVKLLASLLNKDGAGSIKEALDGPDVERTLDGACASFQLTRMDAAGESEVGQVPYLVADLEIEVFV